MSEITSTIRVINNYVHLELVGEFDLGYVQTHFQQAIEVCAHADISKLFFDISGIKGNVSAPHKVSIGYAAVETYERLFREQGKPFSVAVLGQERYYNRGYAPFAPGVDVLRRAGIKIIHTHRREEAVAWLSRRTITGSGPPQLAANPALKGQAKVEEALHRYLRDPREQNAKALAEILKIDLDPQGPVQALFRSLREFHPDLLLKSILKIDQDS